MKIKIRRRAFIATMGAAVAATVPAGTGQLLAQQPRPPQSSGSRKRSDQRSKPVKRLVVMGESNAYGMSASSPRNEWVQVLGNCIREFQEEPLRVFNNAIPSNVISPDAPGYEKGDDFATSPSALERFREHMIEYRPDMAVYAYGLNDSRCGHALESFMRAYRTIVAETRKALPEALLVLVGPYWNVQYDAELWRRLGLANKNGPSKFERAGDDLVLAYNEAIAELASETGAIFVDLYSLLEGSPWLITGDACHFNDIGQRIIGQTVFCQVAAHCSFLAEKSRKTEKELRSNIWTTGGTEALPQVIQRWRRPGNWKR